MVPDAPGHNPRVASIELAGNTHLYQSSRCREVVKAAALTKVGQADSLHERLRTPRNLPQVRS